jgi:hypothetical protein
LKPKKLSQFFKEISRRLGLVSAKIGTIDIPCVAIETVHEVRISHVVIDVRMVIRGADPDALELLDPDPDLGEPEVILELDVFVGACGLTRCRRLRIPPGKVPLADRRPAIRVGKWAMDERLPSDEFAQFLLVTFEVIGEGRFELDVNQSNPPARRRRHRPS